MNTPVVLIIMDGWGISPHEAGNAIALSHVKTIPRLTATYPHTVLNASGLDVGLPQNEDGNTETGHINIGAGRIVYQDIVKIDHAIEDGSFARNEAISGAIKHAQTHASNLHIMGLFSSAGVHASRKHLCSILETCKHMQFDRVFLHLFTDGRDAPPESARSFFRDFQIECPAYTIAKVATIMGRYYGLDRDKRWERTETAYTALTVGSQYTAKSVEEAIEYAYKRGETDEFIKPTVLLDNTGTPYPRIKDNDAIIFYNYRIDRPRQLTRAFILPDFEKSQPPFSFDPYAVKYLKKHTVDIQAPAHTFIRSVILKNLFFVTMTEYERDIPAVVAFPTTVIHESLGEVVANEGIRQLRMSESEKERFVTYYFNGYQEQRFPGEDRLIIPSPKVATYDLMPEMSAREMTEQLIDRMGLGVYGLIVVNFANPDMVAHTGNIEAAKKACAIVDQCVDKIVSHTLIRGGACVITGDHGNVEEMLSPTGGIDTEHSTFPVPFIFAHPSLAGNHTMIPTGRLSDIAPTILKFMNIPIPDSMTGTNLLETIHHTS